MPDRMLPEYVHGCTMAAHDDDGASLGEKKVMDTSDA